MGRDGGSGCQRHLASARQHLEHGGTAATLSAAASDTGGSVRHEDRRARLRARRIPGQADCAPAGARGTGRRHFGDIGSRKERGRVRNRRVPAQCRSASRVRQRCCAADQAMKIGPYTLPSNIVLAPMAGVTDRPFRILCRRFGAGLAASEMLSADVRLWDTPKSRRRMDHRGEPGPRVVQIAGYDPSMMAEAARRNVDAGAQIIDINMGCPAKKVCNRAAGSALLQDEQLVARILHSVVRAVEVPVTLKTRTGWDPSHKNGVRIALIAEDNGIQALAVHGRTRADQYQGNAEHETTAAIKAAVKIPVFANGDVDSPQHALQILRATQCDGIMIGRAAQGRPWIFDG